MKDLSKLKCFQSIEVVQSNSSVVISQRKYIFVYLGRNGYVEL